MKSYGVSKTCMNLNYNSYMRYIGYVNTKVVNWLKNIPIEIWTRHMFDPGVKVDIVIDNLAKSFNNWVGEFKSMLILILLKKIILKLMARFHDIFS